ncbi:MAG: 2-hydroxyacyl-CoA dehydratase [Desulfobacterales bacterium]|nr:2-hydroxyacyl-CoA dehydratase [Desulfobacterales bacterium]
MNDMSDQSDSRKRRMLKKVQREAHAEFEEARLNLARRADHHPAWDYFLDMLARPLTPGALQEAVGRPLVEHLCNQAPYELFHAMGVHPIRLGSGCFSVGRLVASRVPVLMCPMLKAAAGMTRLHDGAPSNDASPGVGGAPALRVAPTTCDWVVKFPEITGAPPADAPSTDAPSARMHFMELPHLRQGEKGQARWLEEIYDLVRFLENRTGRKLKRKILLSSVRTFMRAWSALGSLIELRREGRIAGVWFMAATNSFMLDSVERWTENIHRAMEAVKAHPRAPGGQGVYLAGSPIVFPNFKLPELIEAAGMHIRGDDLCTSERIWPGAVCYDDPSRHGLLRALAERYHNACICPTFADNERRINKIFNTLQRRGIRGVIHHVLKGCHPFDIESFDLEPRLKRHGYKFLKIETDYVQEDSRNLLTRLEAFGTMLTL